MNQTRATRDKAADDAEKAKKAAAKAKLKADKKAKADAAKAKGQQEKADKKKREDEEKETRKLMSGLNVKVTDKKATLHTMQLIFSHNVPKTVQAAVMNQQQVSLASVALFLSLMLYQLAENEVSFCEEHAKVAGCPVVTWASTLSKKFDSGSRQFVPCEETTKPENAALLYLQPADIITLIEEDELSNAVDKIRAAYGLVGLHAKMFIMVVGAITASAAKGRVETGLARLQIRQHTHHIHVNNMVDIQLESCLILYRLKQYRKPRIDCIT